MQICISSRTAPLFPAGIRPENMRMGAWCVFGGWSRKRISLLLQSWVSGTADHQFPSFVPARVGTGPERVQAVPPGYNSPYYTILLKTRSGTRFPGTWVLPYPVSSESPLAHLVEVDDGSQLREVGDPLKKIIFVAPRLALAATSLGLGLCLLLERSRLFGCFGC